MSRHKHIDTSPLLLAVDLERQLLPGSFAHAVHHLLDHDFDLSGFDARYGNNASGAPAYPPGMLLKVILCSYAEGVVSSRGMERLCREHVRLIAFCGDSAPHFTTPAAFVSSLDVEVASLFAQVLFLYEQGVVRDGSLTAFSLKLFGKLGTRRSVCAQEGHPCGWQAVGCACANPPYALHQSAGTARILNTFLERIDEMRETADGCSEEILGALYTKPKGLHRV